MISTLSENIVSVTCFISIYLLITKNLSHNEIMKDLFVSPKSEETKTGQGFLDASTKGYKDSRTENMAISHSSTGDVHLDDFAKSGSYRNRSTETIFSLMESLWKVNPVMTFKLALYLRLISRRIRGFIVTDTVQKGQGNKDESLRRMLWIAYEYPDEFYKNLWLIPLVGSFKDLWTLLGIDYKGKLDRKQFFELMERGLRDEQLRDLVFKYMPQIRSKAKCTTDRAKALNALAKEFAGFLKMNYREYRIIKSSGVAHTWQQQISKEYFDEIDFKKISGKALSLLIKGKFLENNKLVEKYTLWIESQPVAKFTGYVYELYKQIRINRNITGYQKMTVNKQFDGLVELAKKDRGGITGNVWCALDTSGSMSWTNLEGDITALDVCVSLGIYFSALNEGSFKDHVILFDTNSRKLKLRGTFTEKVKQVPMNAMGSTNFQSVIDEIVTIRKANPSIPVEDYPTTLLVISDMQFNPSGVRSSFYMRDSGVIVPAHDEITNFEAARLKLSEVGLPMINIIWWDVTGRGKDVPVREGDQGTALLSGFDGAIITQILGGDKPIAPGEIDMHQVMIDALSQDILTQVEI